MYPYASKVAIGETNHELTPGVLSYSWLGGFPLRGVRILLSACLLYLPDISYTYLRRSVFDDIRKNHTYQRIPQLPPTYYTIVYIFNNNHTISYTSRNRKVYKLFPPECVLLIRYSNIIPETYD